jgi:hypothetical protein
MVEWISSSSIFEKKSTKVCTNFQRLETEDDVKVEEDSDSCEYTAVKIEKTAYPSVWWGIHTQNII